MIKSLNSPAGLLVSGILISAVVVAAYLAGGQPVGDALSTGAGVLVVTVLLVVARRRSDTVAVMSGIGDERIRHLYVHSVAMAGAVMSVVLPGWWLVTVASGDPNPTLGLLCAIFAVAWVAAVIVVSRRS